jgi:hypothetical protein
MKVIYTNKYDSKLIETHYLLKVSHHHYWLSTFSDVCKFMDSKLFDTRMSLTTPIN